MKLTFLMCAVAAAWGVSAAVGEYPTSPWETMRLERTQTEIRIKDAAGRWLMTLRGEPTGASVEKVVAALGADGLAIDAGAAFASGLRKLTMTTEALDAKPLEGRSCILETTLQGPRGAEVMPYFEGHGPQPVGHYYRSMRAKTKGRSRAYALLADVPTGLKELHIRFDVVRQPVGQPIRLRKFRFGPVGELSAQARETAVKPELLFRADFEGTADATFAKGAAKPLRQENLAYAPGVDGQAVRVSRKAKSLLEYAIRGNVDSDRGAVSMWVKREWDFTVAEQPFRALFCYPWPTRPDYDRVGSGALWFWFFGTTLRADQSNDEDTYRTCSVPANGDWLHLVYMWDVTGVRIFVNGTRRDNASDGDSPMIEALKAVTRQPVFHDDFTAFSIGSRGVRDCADALIDDFRIYSAPLGDEAVRALYREHAAKVGKGTPRPDYATLFAADGPNAFEKPPFGAGGLPGALELVEEVTFDAGSPERLGTNRFNAVGAHAFKTLGGTSYLELGAKAGSRAAFRFGIDTNAPLFCFEFDYPDDAKRTADLIVQPCRGGDYALQVGYAAGDEYPNTGKILTHRCLYWSSVPDVAVVLMTAREGVPAALSAIRLYRVKAGGLPVAAVNEPNANADGWHRSVALYFEDPAVGYDFGLPRDTLPTPQGIGRLADRVAALMKYTGENVFAYPGAWYHGLVGDSYMPRPHAQDFLTAWYVKFDKEGLGVIPTVNPNTMPIPSGLVTLASMSDGSLHPTEISIHATGKPNWGRWHDTPPNFNFHHPKVQAHIAGIIDTLLAQGRDHSSFKGVCLHLTRHCLLWFGDEKSGYNDYTIAAFEREKKVKVRGPSCAKATEGKEGEGGAVDWNGPLRGKRYYERIAGDPALHAAWLQWRCDQVTRFYADIARKLAAARPDLKLWINVLVPPDVKDSEFTRPDYIVRANRRCGLDGPALTKAAPNVILSQTLVPADYRWRDAGGYPSKAAQDHQRVVDAQAGFYDLLKGADYPWVHQHDRYWESAIGRSGGSLSSDWMTECGWRVSTINPSGRNALRHFVQPLRHTDVLGLSKGGFLIGTYGMEDVLVPFVRAFRALPAVVMRERGRIGEVVTRQVDFDGRSFFYIVNTGATEASVTVRFPDGTEDLVSGERFEGARESMLKTAPYELRSFAAPSGRPVLNRVSP